ncbi:hypothetical protein E3P89_03323 [Wallemia ichthyophaga]|uniref:40S ribosomal protein S23 n=1 Tax=Wallemia ichthyophaga TaxID=245174 RepID=A0A4T0HUT2_WALIC|nr:hypothetical protein E3P93_03306 [Wallemia ichthyophaga]TIB09333.1 hypothetical protein E3P90_03305 [Wallemia ichthyophaga]TIB20226.1 hypothetical protein E3P89_03323 [Wallemia ichthyophaga]TIB21809.1 hypothetical protein E3P88_03318 [Wallemia ichthyophaga]
MPRGLQTARKLKTIRRDNRWADLQYNKKALGNFWKTSPTGGSSHAKGIVLEKVGVEAKQPNSAIRKCVRVQLIKNGKKVTAFVPNDGGLNFVDENDEVLISGFGKKGKARGDCPGVRFKVVKVSGVGISALQVTIIHSENLLTLLQMERYQGEAKILRATFCVVLASRPADNIKINKFSKSLMSFRSK